MPGHIERTDDLAKLLAVLPPHLRTALDGHDQLDRLLEIVLDLGRLPEARFPGEYLILSDDAITGEDLEYVIKHVGAFGSDNRAGIERTLHRISAIRNRNGRVIGLTCRVGRAVFGTVDILRDVVESGVSLLLLGPPGVGKTTLLRETARVLADEFFKRVVIVDTSNEIAGDGDVPHPAIGRARRMQVVHAEEQASVMIEAVENHMPQVVVIDEIGTEAEARAARTIAERGVQLIGTAHGNTLENLILNPTLSDLIGGIQSVTLSDEEARKRRSQKTVLEREAPPTFDTVVEIRERGSLSIHHDVAHTVDRMLRGGAPAPEERRRMPSGEIEVSGEQATYGSSPGVPDPSDGAYEGSRRADGTSNGLTIRRTDDGSGGIEWLAPPPSNPNGRRLDGGRPKNGTASAADGRGSGRIQHLFPYAVSRNRLDKAIAGSNVPVRMCRDLKDADLVLTTKGQYRKLPKRLREAEARGLPIYIIRSNTVRQMTEFVERLGSGDADQSLGSELEPIGKEGSDGDERALHHD